MGDSIVTILRTRHPKNWFWHPGDFPLLGIFQSGLWILAFSVGMESYFLWCVVTVLQSDNLMQSSAVCENSGSSTADFQYILIRCCLIVII
jgi:hypothetical protein